MHQDSDCIQPGAVKLVLCSHWMHATQVHPVTTENQFPCTRLYAARASEPPHIWSGRTLIWRHKRPTYWTKETPLKLLVILRQYTNVMHVFSFKRWGIHNILFRITMTGHQSTWTCCTTRSVTTSCTIGPITTSCTNRSITTSCTNRSITTSCTNRSITTSCTASSITSCCTNRSTTACCTATSTTSCCTITSIPTCCINTFTRPSRHIEEYSSPSW